MKVNRLASRRPGQRGAVTMDAVLVMPFVLAILLCVLNIGAASSSRIRSQTAVRESAFFYARQTADKNGNASTGRAQLLMVDAQMRRHRGRFSVELYAESSLARAELGKQETSVSGVLQSVTLGPALGSLGKPRVYTVYQTPDVPYPGWLKTEDDPVVLVMDDATWSYGETGDLYESALGGVGGWIERVFK